MKKIPGTVIISVGVLICIAFIYLAIPVVVRGYSSWQNYTTRIAKQSNYAKITTPLPVSAAEDICLKFEIDPEDARCLPGAIVYAPDFFIDIKVYIDTLPDEDATFENIQEKLEIYLISCENPNDEGHYRCRYDIRGDGIYPIFIYFTIDGHIYRVIANTGGS